MQRRILLLVLVAALLVAVSVVGAQDAPVKVKLVVNGVLGDKSFFDSAQRGMDMIADEFDAEVNTVELGIDPANWETGLVDAMADEDTYDVLITGTFQMIDFLAKHAHEHADKTFFFFDASMPYDDAAVCVEGCKNVYSITYKQNEGSFLAGVYAAAMSPNGVIGAVGGQDIPVINDFIVGYEQGACLVNAEVTALAQYAGSWNDPAKGKEIALAMFQQNADIVFQVAGGTGVGVFEAAEEQGKWAIGVDSDQSAIIMDTDPEQAARIATSMLKNVDASLYRGFSMFVEGTLPLGTAEGLGIAEGGVGLAKGDVYVEVTPQNVQDLIEAVQQAVVDGKVAVNTVFTSEDAAAKVGQGCAAMPAVDLDLSMYMG